jgi:hypothetical protein
MLKYVEEERHGKASRKDVAERRHEVTFYRDVSP